jgi:hypothetical protein
VLGAFLLGLEIPEFEGPSPAPNMISIMLTKAALPAKTTNVIACAALG